MKAIQVTRLTDTAMIPTQGSPGAAGWDLYADESMIIQPGGRAMIATGIAVRLPVDMAGLIWPRSGLALKQGIDVLAGVVDSDYRGPVGVVLQNHGAGDVYIAPGDRIAQLLVQPVVYAHMVAVDRLGDTHRGERGFGSTEK